MKPKMILFDYGETLIHELGFEPLLGNQAMLHALKRLKIRTGVISNITISGACLKKRLDRLLPGNEFEFVISSCDYLFRKPHPRIFQLACKKSELNASEIWFCGDNPVCDIKGAKSVGMHPVLFSTDKQQSDELENLRIASWNQLIERIEKESY